MNGIDINPKFYALLRRSDVILAELRELKRDPDNVDWREVRDRSHELLRLADQMEHLLPLTSRRGSRRLNAEHCL